MTSLDLDDIRKIGNTFALKKQVEKMKNEFILAKPNNFGTKTFLMS